MSQSDLWHQRTGVFKLNLHKEKGENLIELVFEKELFRNVKTQCYDILHLSSQTPHRRRRNTEWLTCLIINSLIDTHALLSRFFVFFHPLCLMRASKPDGAQWSGHCLSWTLWCFSSTKGHSRCTSGSNNLLLSNSAPTHLYISERACV